jgi:hypothetical protein
MSTFITVAIDKQCNNIISKANNSKIIKPASPPSNGSQTIPSQTNTQQPTPRYAAPIRSTSSNYEIEVSHNDELFVINGGKFTSKTYCFDWDKGDRVMFIEGSPYGACVSAVLVNMRTKKTCEVWCE